MVDVGGGIGSTSMLLASAFSPATGGEDLGLKFVIQDRAVVVDMGEKVFASHLCRDSVVDVTSSREQAWKEKCPELLESGVAKFQGSCSRNTTHRLVF